MKTGPDAPRLAAERRARMLIDRLADAGWSVQDTKDLNLFAAEGSARREVTIRDGRSRARGRRGPDRRPCRSSKPWHRHWSSNSKSAPEFRATGLIHDLRSDFTYTNDPLRRPSADY